MKTTRPLTKYLLILPLLLSPVSASTTRASWHEGLSGMTTASRAYGCGSVLLVWNAHDRHARRWRVTVRDYGPFVAGRLLDLSPRAFQRVFGSTRKGVCVVRYRVLRVGHCRIHRH